MSDFNEADLDKDVCNDFLLELKTEAFNGNDVPFVRAIASYLYLFGESQGRKIMLSVSAKELNEQGQKSVMFLLYLLAAKKDNNISIKCDDELAVVMALSAEDVASRSTNGEMSFAEAKKGYVLSDSKIEQVLYGTILDELGFYPRR